MSRTNIRSRTDRPLLPQLTIEVAARSFYKQALRYGFALGDFVRFTHMLLSVAMARGERGEPPAKAAGSSPAAHTALPLVGSKVTIRRFDAETDRALLERWVLDPEGRFFLLSTASGHAYGADQLVESPQNLIGTIVYQSQPIGCVAYLDYSQDQKRAELRKLIGEPEMRGLGLAHEAAELWVGYGVGALGLRKIYLNTLATHIRNIQINEALGFQLEGILRSELLIDGEYHDVLRMGLCVD